MTSIKYLDHNQQSEVYDFIAGNTPSECILNAFTNYYGMQLIDSDFYAFLCDEGVIPPLFNEEDEESEE